MGQRTWLLRGPIQAGEPQPAIDPASAPRPGEGGWSTPVYFHDDKIDLDRYYGDPVHSLVYAYAEFVAPRHEPAQLWVGSDEDVTVWIDGAEVYSYTGRRRHRLPNDRVPVQLTQGRHRVMVRARQRRGDFDFSLKLCEMEDDPRYDGNHIFGLHWSVPGESTLEVAEVLVGGDRRSRRSPWYDEHEVDTTIPKRVFLKAILPWHGRAPWVRLEWPRVWGDEMELQATLTGTGLEILTGNLQAFRLEPEGPLEAPEPGLAVVVDGGRIGALRPGRWRLARDEEGGWSMTPASPLDWEELSFIGEATQRLGRDHRPGEWDSPLGNWYCDAILFATGADVAFQNNGGIRGDLAQGPITLRDIFRINFPNHLFTFPLTGAELLQVLEFDNRDGKERPMLVGGIEYVVDRSRPEGERVVASNISPGRTYTVAAQAYLCDRAQRFFGRDITWRDTGVQTVDAQIRLVQQQGRIAAPATGRIRRAGDAGKR